MRKIAITLVILVLIGTTLACSFTVNTNNVKLTETKVLDINEPAPTDLAGARVEIEMGAGKLNIAGGAQGLVEGTITYNVFGWTPEVIRSDGSVSIQQGRLEDIKIPNKDVVNDWDILLGAFPTDLEISAGAYEGLIDVSGVSLTNLKISDGASKATVEFNSLNPAVMDSFSYKTGASQVKIYGIGNANTSQFTFDGGAGDYTLDFSGTLKQDLAVNITSGVSKIEIIIPENVPARVTISGGLNNVSPSGTWSITGSVYEKTGTGPRIDITIDMGVGSLDLISQ